MLNGKQPAQRPIHAAAANILSAGVIACMQLCLFSCLPLFPSDAMNACLCRGCLC